MGSDSFHLPGGELLRKMLGGNPEAPKEIPTTTKKFGGLGRKRTAPEETEELLPPETLAEPEEKKPKVILRNPKWEFLAHLDDLSDPQLKISGMRQVLKAMEDSPSEVTSRICETLAWDADFLSDPDRKMFLLPALAAVRPMSGPAEAVFRSANGEGYFNFNGPLLVANGSPRALALFEDMVADASVRPADRVDMLHHAVLANRTEGPVVDACLRLLARGLEPEVETGVAETLYDYREKRWFGPGRLSDDIQDAIEGSVLEIREILTARTR